MERHILMLTIYDALSCINADQRKKLVITEIKNQKDKRLSRSLGNVNMTDYWLTSIDEFARHDLRYTLQQIALLRDGSERWWKEICKSNAKIWVGLGFLKINRLTTEYDIYDVVKEKIEREYPDAAIYYTFGNADFVIALKENDRALLITKLKKIKDFCECYSYYYVVSDVSAQEEKRWQLDSVESFVGEECKRHECFEGTYYRMFQEIKSKMLAYRDIANKKMVSYCHALLQIINVMLQYEQDKIYKDYFYIFYPTVQLFLQLLEDALHKRNEIETKIQAAPEGEEKQGLLIELNVMRQKIEKAFSDFLDDQEILLHHIGNSCRNLVIESGRCELPYDIPIKNCKLYLAYLSAITHILNDKRQYQYQYCLAPLAYSRPTTGIFDFGLSPNRRLIEVRISRSMLCMPRELLVILAHEVSHYVGTDTRVRNERNRAYIKILAQTLTFCILGGGTGTRNITEIQRIYLSTLKKALFSRIYKEIILNYNRIVGELEKRDSNPELLEGISHFHKFKKNIRKAVLKVLEDNGGILRETVCTIDQQIKNQFLSAKDRLDAAQQINSIQQSIMNEIRSILYKKEPWDFLEEFAKCLKEMYADLCAVKILDLNLDDLLEALIISEGKVLSMDQVTPALINRIALVDMVMQEVKGSKWADSSSYDERQDESLSADIRRDIKKEIKQYEDKVKRCVNSDDSSITTDDIYDRQKIDFFYCTDIVSVERQYLLACNTKLNEQLSVDTDVKTLVSLVRSLVAHFSLYDENKEPSYSEFFRKFRQLEHWYAESIKNLMNQKGEIKVK